MHSPCDLPAGLPSRAPIADAGATGSTVLAGRQKNPMSPRELSGLSPIPDLEARLRWCWLALVGKTGKSLVHRRAEAGGEIGTP